MRANYELPFGKSAKGLQKLAIGGWQVNTIAFWQSGEPYTVTDGQNLINLPNITSDRPNQISGQSCQAANPGINGWINLNAWQQQPIGNPGNEGRAQCYGPSWRGVDFSVFKDFVFMEKYSCRSVPRLTTSRTRQTSRFPTQHLQLDGQPQPGWHPDHGW